MGTQKSRQSVRGTLAMQLYNDVRVRTRFILASGNERYLLWTFRSSKSDHPGKLNSTAVMRCVWQYLAAYPSPHSSNAKSLCGAFSADSPKIEAPRGRTSLLTDSKVRVLPAWHVRLELGNVEFSDGKF